MIVMRPTVPGLTPPPAGYPGATPFPPPINGFSAVPTGPNVADGFLMLDQNGYGPTIFTGTGPDDIQIYNPNVYSPRLTSVLNGLEFLSAQMNQFNNYNNGLTPVNPAGAWVVDNINAITTGQQPGTMMRPQGQPINPNPTAQPRP
jgi:hypothetical protein